MTARWCAIMQPTYLPWAGYFNLIASVDRFVFLDDVQYARKTWQCKNRILVDGKVETLEVPVVKAPLQTGFDVIKIDYAKPWVERHLAVLVKAYAVSPFGGAMLDIVRPILLRNPEHLVALNTQIIEAIAQALGPKVQFSVATDLGCGGHRSDHVAAICKAVDATHYLSPEGARAYLAEDDFQNQHPIHLAFQDYPAIPYPQAGGGVFESHLSILDVFANLGPEATADYVRGSD